MKDELAAEPRRGARSGRSRGRERPRAPFRLRVCYIRLPFEKKADRDPVINVIRKMRKEWAPRNRRAEADFTPTETVCGSSVMLMKFTVKPFERVVDRSV